MNLERIVLTLGGIAIIAAFFLPYLQFKKAFTEAYKMEVSISGMSMVQTGLEFAEVVPGNTGEGMLDFVKKGWKDSQNFQQLGALIGFIFVLIGPFIFLLYSLGYVFRGLTGRQYKRGIFFTIVYTGISWLTFYLLGNDLGISLNFFSMAGPGFWVAFGGMFAAAMSLFFSKSLE